MYVLFSLERKRNYHRLTAGIAVVVSYVLSAFWDVVYCGNDAGPTDFEKEGNTSLSWSWSLKRGVGVCMLVFAVMRQSETGIVTKDLGNDKTRLPLRTKHDVHHMY